MAEPEKGILIIRIAALAEGGMVLIGIETARRVEGLFSIKKVGKKQLKNVKEEVLIYQVLGEADNQVDR